VALQELDVGQKRTGQVDQADRIAQLLGWHALFNPSLRYSGELYGDGIVSRYPLTLRRAGGLPGWSARPELEPRGAIWVEIETGSGPLQLINTHLGLFRRERELQAAALLGEEWLGHTDCRDPVILCGDFNAVPVSRVYKMLATQLREARPRQRGTRLATFPSSFPVLSLDHIFYRGAMVQIRRIHSLDWDLARRASDHLPLVVDVDLNPLGTVFA
ncbi:MAG: endonuclease/exonuclease/phosphatase family protein, partial [Pirellulaceae bacterium]